MKLLVVFGTRPEAIKLAPVIRSLTRYPECKVIVCSTGQHREMLEQVLCAFDVRPDVDLGLMHANQSLTEVAARVLCSLDPVLTVHRPDWMVVQGDTTTVAAAALAASYHKCKIAHVEAGLRSYDRDNPFPEEANRCMTTSLANLHFAPTENARQNLLREGVSASTIFVTGNTVIDALQWAMSIPYETVASPEGQKVLEMVDSVRAGGRDVILVTAHRRENIGEPLKQICSAIHELANRYRDRVHFFYPVHLNPRVQEEVARSLGGATNVTLCSPLDYFSLVNLMSRSKLILTDSGGIQEEAPALRVPVLVLRNTTERPEGVSAGVARLVGTDRTKIISETAKLLDSPGNVDRMRTAESPYGDGHASDRIAEVLACMSNAGAPETDVVDTPVLLASRLPHTGLRA